MTLRLTGCALTLALLLWGAAVGAMESEDCLECHGDADMVGEELTLDPVAFGATAHAEMGCPTCHESVTDEHPDDGLTPTVASCGDCHDGVVEEYGRTAHAESAECADCHNPHAVHAPTAVCGLEMNKKCAACHDGAETVSTHDEWLPQADLHLATLPCISCHTGSEEYVISTYLTRQQGDTPYLPYEPVPLADLQKLAGDGTVQSLVDLNGDDFISLSELRAFNANPDYSGLRLLGMMTPESLSHTFEIINNRADCTFCHAAGPASMEKSYVAFPNVDGSYSRMRVEDGAAADILNSIPDFYLMGATRSTVLNYVGLLIIAGGMVMPIGHGTLRFLTRKNREGKEH